MEGSKVKDLLPTMKTLKSVDDIPLFSHVQVKADGEAGYINYNRNGFSFILNKWGRKRSNLPALNQFINAMNQTDIQSAELLCELYAKEHGKPLILPRFIHLVKSHNPADHLKVHIGIWDLISVNNVKTSEPPHRKWQTISGWVKNCTHVSVLPYMTPNSRLAINGFWKYHVEKLGYEGLVVRTSNGIYKLKPKGELDAVIIGINKKSGYGKTNLFAQKQVTSLKLALMTPEGNFVEVGDVASGIDHQLRSALWRLMKTSK